MEKAVGSRRGRGRGERGESGAGRQEDGEDEGGWLEASRGEARLGSEIG